MMRTFSLSSASMENETLRGLTVRPVVLITSVDTIIKLRNVSSKNKSRQGLFSRGHFQNRTVGHSRNDLGLNECRLAPINCATH
jgi:hypothetical protein